MFFQLNYCVVDTTTFVILFYVTLMTLQNLTLKISTELALLEESSLWYG